MRELAKHHVGGHLKVAPEHTDPGVLDLMKKPGNDDFEKFDDEFKQASKAGRQEAVSRAVLHRQPSGQRPDAMIDLALFLKRNHYQPDQVQDFIPSPFDIAACMYHTGSTRSRRSRSFTMKPVYIAKHLRDRKLQRALLQFFKPENYFEVRQARTSRPAGFDRQRLRLLDSRAAAEGGAFTAQGKGERGDCAETEGDHIRAHLPLSGRGSG